MATQTITPRQAWILAARPKTLPAALSPVVVGAALAIADGGFAPLPALAAAAGALLLQILSNFANDYSDFFRGADTPDRLGPVRVTSAGLIAPAALRKGIIAVIALAVLIGLYLVWVGGWPILLVGVAAILAALAYTGGPFPFGYYGLGEVFVFLFFGVVAVCGTYYVQTLALTPQVVIASVAVGALITAILVVNNYRDAETDARAGKRTSVVRFGRKFARWQFALGHAVALLVPAMLAVHWDAFDWILLPIVLTPEAMRQVFRLKELDSPMGLITLLGDVGRYLAAYALLLSAGIVCS